MKKTILFSLLFTIASFADTSLSKDSILMPKI